MTDSQVISLQENKEKQLISHLRLIFGVLGCVLYRSLKEQKSPESVLEQIDKTLQALSNQTRRDILLALKDQKMYVNELIFKLQEHPQSITRHLRLLKDLEFIKCLSTNEKSEQKKGTKGRPRLYYTVHDDLRGVLEECPFEDAITISNDLLIPKDLALFLPSLLLLTRQVLNEDGKSATQNAELIENYKKVLLIGIDLLDSLKEFVTTEKQ